MHFNVEISQPYVEKVVCLENGYLKYKKELTEHEFAKFLEILIFEDESTPLMSAEVVYFESGTTHYAVINDDDNGLCLIVGYYQLNPDGYFGLQFPRAVHKMLAGFFEDISPRFEKIVEHGKFVFEDGTVVG